MGSFFQFSIIKIGTLCFLPSPLCGEMGGRGLKHCKTQYFWHLDFRRGFPGAQEAQAASQLLPVWVHYLGSMLPLGVCSTTLGSILNYPEEYEEAAGGGRLGFLGAPGKPLRKSRCQKYCVLQCLSSRPPISPQSGEGRKHKIPIFIIEKE